MIVILTLARDSNLDSLMGREMLRYHQLLQGLVGSQLAATLTPLLYALVSKWEIPWGILFLVTLCQDFSQMLF